MKARTYSPKEFSALLAENGIERSPEWVRQQCALFVRARGRRGIAVILPAPPYLIPESEEARFRRPHLFSARSALSA